MDVIASLSLLLTFSIPSVILFSIIFLILKYIFKVRNRNVNAIITLIISLVITSSILFLLATVFWGGIFFESLRYFVFPWTDCMSFSNCPPGYVCATITPLICRIIQLWEYELIAIAALVIIIPPIIQKIKKPTKKS